MAGALGLSVIVTGATGMVGEGVCARKKVLEVRDIVALAAAPRA